VPFRTDMYSDAELARQHGCSRTAIQKRVKAEKWSRDLSSAVRQAANAKLVQEDAKIAGYNQGSDRDTIERASDTRVDVIKSHRRDINRLCGLEETIVEKLKNSPKKTYITQFKGDIVKEDIGITVMEMSAALNNLVNTMQKRIQLERQAFNIKDDDQDNTVNPIAQILKDIDGTSRGLPVFDNEQ
jgi:hypothetical protein